MSTINSNLEQRVNILESSFIELKNYNEFLMSTIASIKNINIDNLLKDYQKFTTDNKPKPTNTNTVNQTSEPKPSLTLNISLPTDPKQSNQVQVVTQPNQQNQVTQVNQQPVVAPTDLKPDNYSHHLNLLGSKISPYDRVGYMTICSSVATTLVFKKRKNDFQDLDEFNQEGSKSALFGAADDALHMYNYLMEKGQGYINQGKFEFSNESVNSLSKENFLISLKNFFNSATNDGCIIYYSGHGLADSKLLFETSQESYYIHYEEVLALWKTRVSPLKNKHLLLVLDCCYAGSWVQQLFRNGDYDDVSIQASSTLKQKSNDLGMKKGSLYTALFLMANKALDVEGAVDYSFKNEALRTKLAGQYPVSFGVKAVPTFAMGLEHNMLVNSWQELVGKGLKTELYGGSQQNLQIALTKVVHDKELPLFSVFKHAVFFVKEGFVSCFAELADIEENRDLSAWLGESESKPYNLESKQSIESRKKTISKAPTLNQQQSNKLNNLLMDLPAEEEDDHAKREKISKDAINEKYQLSFVYKDEAITKLMSGSISLYTEEEIFAGRYFNKYLNKTHTFLIEDTTADLAVGVLLRIVKTLTKYWETKANIEANIKKEVENLKNTTNTMLGIQAKSKLTSSLQVLETETKKEVGFLIQRSVLKLTEIDKSRLLSNKETTTQVKEDEDNEGFDFYEEENDLMEFEMLTQQIITSVKSLHIEGPMDKKIVMELFNYFKRFECSINHFALGNMPEFDFEELISELVAQNRNKQHKLTSETNSELINSPNKPNGPDHNNGNPDTYDDEVTKSINRNKFGLFQHFNDLCYLKSVYFNIDIPRLDFLTSLKNFINNSKCMEISIKFNPSILAELKSLSLKNNLYPFRLLYTIRKLQKVEFAHIIDIWVDDIINTLEISELQSFVLTNSAVERDKAEKISKLLANHENIHTLTVIKCSLTEIPELAPNLTTINLSGNRISNIKLDFLLEMLRKLKLKYTINLSDNCISNQCVEQISVFLKKNLYCTEFNLSKNLFNQESFNNIISSLVYNNTLLTLDISHLEIADASVIKEFLKNQKTLRSLIARSCRLVDESFEKLFEIFLYTNSNFISYLDVSDNKISNLQCYERIGRYVRYNKKLKILNMSNCVNIPLENLTGLKKPAVKDMILCDDPSKIRVPMDAFFDNANQMEVNFSNWKAPGGFDVRARALKPELFDSVNIKNTELTLVDKVVAKVGVQGKIPNTTNTVVDSNVGNNVDLNGTSPNSEGESAFIFEVKALAIDYSQLSFFGNLSKLESLDLSFNNPNSYRSLANIKSLLNKGGLKDLKISWCKENTEFVKPIFENFNANKNKLQKEENKDKDVILFNLSNASIRTIVAEEADKDAVEYLSKMCSDNAKVHEILFSMNQYESASQSVENDAEEQKHWMAGAESCNTLHTGPNVNSGNNINILNSGNIGNNNVGSSDREKGKTKVKNTERVEDEKESKEDCEKEKDNENKEIKDIKMIKETKENQKNLLQQHNSIKNKLWSSEHTGGKFGKRFSVLGRIGLEGVSKVGENYEIPNKDDEGGNEPEGLTEKFVRVCSIKKDAVNNISRFSLVNSFFFNNHFEALENRKGGVEHIFKPTEADMLVNNKQQKNITNTIVNKMNSNVISQQPEINSKQSDDPLIHSNEKVSLNNKTKTDKSEKGEKQNKIAADNPNKQSIELKNKLSKQNSFNASKYQTRRNQQTSENPNAHNYLYSRYLINTEQQTSSTDVITLINHLNDPIPPNTTKLRLNSNYFSLETFTNFEMANLTHLELKGVYIKDFITILSASLSKYTPKLTRIAFIASEFNKNELQALEGIFNILKGSLQEVHFVACSISSNELSLLFKSLNLLPNLQLLNISENLIDDLFSSCLANFIESTTLSQPLFSKLILRNANLTKDRINVIVNAFKGREIKLLDISGFRINKEAYYRYYPELGYPNTYSIIVDYPTQVFNSKNVFQYHLVQLCLDHVDLESIKEQLYYFFNLRKSLKYLTLRSCYRENTMMKLLNLLIKNTHISHLSLSGTLVNSKSSKYLKEIVNRINHNFKLGLVSLDLNNCQIEDKTFSNLSPALRSSKIKLIILSNNMMTSFSLLNLIAEIKQRENKNQTIVMSRTFSAELKEERARKIFLFENSFRIFDNQVLKSFKLNEAVKTEDVKVVDDEFDVNIYDIITDFNLKKYYLDILDQSLKEEKDPNSNQNKNNKTPSISGVPGAITLSKEHRYDIYGIANLLSDASVSVLCALYVGHNYFIISDSEGTLAKWNSDLSMRVIIYDASFHPTTNLLRVNHFSFASVSKNCSEIRVWDLFSKKLYRTVHLDVNTIIRPPCYDAVVIRNLKKAVHNNKYMSEHNNPTNRDDNNPDTKNKPKINDTAILANFFDKEDCFLIASTGNNEQLFIYNALSDDDEKIIPNQNPNQNGFNNRDNNQLNRLNGNNNDNQNKDKVKDKDKETKNHNMLSNLITANLAMDALISTPYEIKKDLNKRNREEFALITCTARAQNLILLGFLSGSLKLFSFENWDQWEQVQELYSIDSSEVNQLSICQGLFLACKSKELQIGHLLNLQVCKKVPLAEDMSVFVNDSLFQLNNSVFAAGVLMLLASGEVTYSNLSLRIKDWEETGLEAVNYEDVEYLGIEPVFTCNSGLSFYKDIQKIDDMTFLISGHKTPLVTMSLRSSCYWELLKKTLHCETRVELDFLVNEMKELNDEKVKNLFLMNEFSNMDTESPQNQEVNLNFEKKLAIFDGKNLIISNFEKVLHKIKLKTTTIYKLDESKLMYQENTNLMIFNVNDYSNYIFYTNFELTLLKLQPINKILLSMCCVGKDQSMSIVLLDYSQKQKLKRKVLKFNKAIVNTVKVNEFSLAVKTKDSIVIWDILNTAPLLDLQYLNSIKGSQEFSHNENLIRINDRIIANIENNYIIVYNIKNGTVVASIEEEYDVIEIYRLSDDLIISKIFKEFKIVSISKSKTLKTILSVDSIIENLENSVFVVDYTTNSYVFICVEKDVKINRFVFRGNIIA